MLATLVVVLIAAIGGYFVLQAQTEQAAQREKQIAQSMDRLRSLMMFMVVRATESEKGWAVMPYEGKRFVVASVAFGDLAATRREQLEILWSPALDEQFQAMDLAAYEGLTRKALAAGRDVSALTSHAGRLNAAGACAVTPEALDRGVPILADAQIEGVVILGFTSGAVKQYTYEELGLPENGPVVFGPDSPAELLRCLSDK
ncbi:MAG: hypothetical protein QNJ98_19950 [Planctomycetota bacterium]|nr:hypothetical protein [Planctomycetota bacterium]